MKDIGIYIHIPFCQSRCIYCDFYSTILGAEWQMRYIDALSHEMRTRLSESYKDEKPRARTIYIGGGTPSQLTPAALSQLWIELSQHFLIPDDIEITLEANPDDVTPQWIASLQQTPVNRISMGVQSLCDDTLRFLHRRHTAEQVYQAVSLLRQAGYHELSLDLIYGLPHQSMADFERDVAAILQLGVPHLSAYALQFEPGTRLWQMRERGEINEAEEELMLAEYHYLIDTTAAHGMEHYEISNFALPDHHSRHNSSYWTGLPYLGFGPGAHSYDGDRTRRENLGDVRRYIQYYTSAMPEGEEPCIVETLNHDERYEEMVMLRLRTAAGLDLNQLEQQFGASSRRYIERAAKPHLDCGNLQKTGETLRLTRQSLFISDSVIRDLI